MIVKFTGILFFFVLLCTSLFAQTADTTATGTGATGDFIDIGELEVKIEPDKPRVIVVTDRIKPQFSEVDLEKSFMDELLEKSPTDDLKESMENELIKIDTEKLVNRNR